MGVIVFLLIVAALIVGSVLLDRRRRRRFQAMAEASRVAGTTTSTSTEGINSSIAAEGLLRGGFPPPTGGLE